MAIPIAGYSQSAHGIIWIIVSQDDEILINLAAC